MKDSFNTYCHLRSLPQGPVYSRFISLIILPLVFIAAFLAMSHKTAAVNRTWDGGGTTNNWSEAANWSGDTPPGPFDIAVFDATSTKDATIDTNIDVAGIQVNTGYTGTITQAAGVNINIGNFGNYSQADGTFNGGNGNFAIAFSFTLSGGTFNAPTGTLSVGFNFTHSAGTFNPNSGTVAWVNGSGTIDLPTSETFNNLNWNLPDGTSRSIPAGDTLIVTGNLALNDGAIGGAGAIEARAGVTVGPNFDGQASGTPTLRITPGDGNPRTLTFNAGAKLISLNINAANVTVVTAGTGTIDLQLGTLTLQAGTIQQGSVGLTVAGYTQSGGVFTGGSGLFKVFNPGGGAPFTLSAGTFTGGSGDITVQATFTLSGGTFTSTTGTLSVGPFTHSAGTFNPNSGTLAFTGSGPTINISATSETFNNVAFNTTTGSSFTIPTGKTLSAAGNLAFNTGLLGGGGTIEARANVTVGPSFGGAASGTPSILFSGSADQTFTNSGGTNPGSTWMVNKSGGILALLSDLILQTTQPLNITAGTFNQGASFNVTIGALTIGAGGTYRNFGTGDLTLGGNVSNDGTIELDGGGPNCGDADSILIRSSASGTQRLWSGAGTLRVQDVDVQDQAGTAAITVFSGTNSGNNGANWTFSAGCAPTEVTLISFTATDYGDGRVQLQWQTGFEADNLGFNLYREMNGKRQLVNHQLVSGSALRADSTLLAGQSYVWWDDPGAQPAGYWLEDIDLSGKSTWHGPRYVKASDGKPPASHSARLIDHLGSGVETQSPATRLERVAPLPAGTAPGDTFDALKLQQPPLASGPAVKIAIRHEGLYRLTQSELRSAGLGKDIDPRLLHLLVDGKEIPLRVSTGEAGRFDEDSFIEFYGLGLDTPSTDARTYWLVVGDQPGRRIPQSSGEGVSSSSTSFTHTVERRDRSVYFSGLRNGERENFFGAVITPNGVDQTVSVSHPSQTATLPAVLEVVLQGVTQLPHRVAVQLNSQSLGAVSFSGQGQGIARFPVPHALLSEGANTIRLVSLGGGRDINLVDRIRLSYEHQFLADEDSLPFVASGKTRMKIGGFTSKAIRVFDVTDEQDVKQLTGEVEQGPGGSYQIAFAVTEPGERNLIALNDSRLKTAAGIQANHPSNLRANKQAADLVILTRRDYFAALEPLKMVRESEGLRVKVIDVEDLYDEFSFGHKTPQAIRDFLSFTRTNWKVAPRYVLFAGDASYDARNYLSFGDRDQVPTKLIDTALMETASDEWFADFDEDGIGDLAVGRLPFQTIGEATTLVSKILGYENRAARPAALLVSDVSEGFDFERANGQLQYLLPSSMAVEEIKRGELEAATAKKRLAEALANGQTLVNYMGHGSVNLWRGDLLTADEARRLENEQLPVFVLMTCLNNYYADPALDSLGEALLKAERGGAVAVWASSGMTMPQEQALMNQALYRELFRPTGKSTKPAQKLRLGEALQRAKAAVGDLDIRRTWTLLGDPTLRLK